MEVTESSSSSLHMFLYPLSFIMNGNECLWILILPSECTIQSIISKALPVSNTELIHMT